MKSIKTKLFLSFLGLMIAFIICGLLFNYFFLEQYFLYKAKSSFVETSNQIVDTYKNNPDNIDDILNIVEQTDGISTIIVDNNLNIRYSSQLEKAIVKSKRLSYEIEQLVQKNTNNLKRDYLFTTIKKLNTQEREIVFINHYSDNDFVILIKPMKSISESVSISNQFYIFAGLIILIFGVIFIYIFSKKITKPVTEMSNVATAITNLEFDKRVNYTSQDEIGSLATSINIMSEKLDYSLNKLKTDVERRKQLVLNMSHELKTPIGVIKGYAEGLKYGVVNDKEKMEKYCTVIAQECDRMDQMVREMLNLSMLETGIFELKPVEFDVCGLILETEQRFASVFEETGIKFDTDCPKNLVVTADYELIRRALDNYITNAINHAQGEKLIKVTAKKNGDCTIISVFNTGEDIPQDKIQNIWDVFYKADKARTRQYGGHGLGLSIVKLIVKLHNGKAWVENVNNGVVFYIEIP